MSVIGGERRREEEPPNFKLTLTIFFENVREFHKTLNAFSSKEKYEEEQRMKNYEYKPNISNKYEKVPSSTKARLILLAQ